MENKKVSFGFENGKLIIKVDLNQDGESALELKIDLKEMPEEVLAAIKNKNK